MMGSEQVELLPVGTGNRTTLAPKTLKPITPKKRTLLTTLFILGSVGMTTLWLVTILMILLEPAPIADGPFANPCPQLTAFTVTLSFGSMSYNDAKLIDAIWNLGIGRGVQALAGWMSYKIFGMAMLRIMQQDQITIDLYAAISFRTLSILTIPKVVLAAISRCSWRGRMLFIWIIISSIYILAMPTLLDLMTGYITKQSAMVPSSNGGLVPLQTVNYSSSQFFSSHGWIYGPSGVTCVPESEYQWGFSLGWTIAVLGTLMVWSWGMFGLWFDAQKNGLFWQMGRRSGLYRNILDVANALEDALGPDTCAYNDDELTTAVEKLEPVGFEAVANGTTGFIALRHDPVGCSALRSSGVEYKRRE
ncbi:hypothetical protein BP5796_05739 [Coleophoma crateriformis]|uniref:Uncharacterized protein n=1 Tax=Coleophoma crateriformis TaxID=565419 RepID=A0A3D8RUZ6_9HELO|nr:hypothetical protein BP5796_05739 [Coleophoma crateriformis]